MSSLCDRYGLVICSPVCSSPADLSPSLPPCNNHQGCLCNCWEDIVKHSTHIFADKAHLIRSKSCYSLAQNRCTVDSVLSGHCLKRTSVLSGQLVWSRQNTPLIQYKTLCVKRTSALCGQRTPFLKIWSIFSVLSGSTLKIHCKMLLNTEII